MGEAAGKGKERRPQVRLGDVCDIYSGSVFPLEMQGKKEGKYPFYKVGDISKAVTSGYVYLLSCDNHIDDDDVKSLNAKILPKNTVVFAKIGAALKLNRRAIVSQPCLVDNNAIGIKAKTDIISDIYLYHFLKSVDLCRYSRETAIPSVKTSDIKQIPIPLPPLPEQRRIAAVLDQVSSLIALRKAQLAKLDLLVKARFVEMFGTENEFSMWQCGTVADVANVFVGVVIKPAQYYTDKRNGIPAFRSQNIGCMKVKDNDWVYFTEEGHLKNKKTIINENDVLVVRSGTPGIACVASAKCSGYNAVDIIIVRPHQNQINPVFLAMFTNMPHGRNQIKEKTGGAAQQHLNIRSYESMKIIRPPLNLQNQFSAFVKQTNRSECEIQHGLIHLETLKKSLMQEYFG